MSTNETPEKIRVGITHGDINGIGYEVILKTLQDPRIMDLCIPVIYGSPKVAAYHRKAIGINTVNLHHIREASELSPQKANIINCVDDNIRVELGKSTQQAGESSFAALEAAMGDLVQEHIDVLVTAPINKYNIQSADFKFPGHTEYLASKTGAKESLMLMVSENIRIGVVTGHIPISEVSKSITKEAILTKLRIMNKSLLEDFGIRKPQIAVLGLNPHAGDNGTLGSEEIDIIIPAIEQAREEGIMAIGPYPADGFFGSSGFTKYDAILAMYHDQGLIPFKSLVFDAGVNYTAGLPIIRTSPGHGTAYEIAGLDKASESSFRNALFLACDIYRNRNQYLELKENAMVVNRKEEFEHNA